MKKKLHVAIALILQDKKLFIAQRNDSSNFEDYWEFPGGKIEKNETAKMALIREIKEEINCNIIIKKPFQTYHFDYDFGTVFLYPFICELSENEKPEKIVHKDFKWITSKEINDYLWIPGDEQLIQDLIINKYI